MDWKKEIYHQIKITRTISSFKKFLQIDIYHPIFHPVHTYIIYDKHNDRYKIGQSVELLKRLEKIKRLSQMFDLELITYIPYDIEGFLHEKLREYPKK